MRSSVLATDNERRRLPVVGYNERRPIIGAIVGFGKRSLGRELVSRTRLHIVGLGQTGNVFVETRIVDGSTQGVLERGGVESRGERSELLARLGSRQADGTGEEL